MNKIFEKHLKKDNSFIVIVCTFTEKVHSLSQIQGRRFTICFTFIKLEFIQIKDKTLYCIENITHEH